ncbi:hypothetical protein AN403_3664 [Pseudomonas fluorescens]|uniref:Uncharacterized protein n=2 Tax=Pseudomonas fluorescens TaxID=294 RepID=A0A0P8X2F9_PSEFL|nr:hypothetical protein AN403_3664 [Pseudomonas fluorescens]
MTFFEKVLDERNFQHDDEDGPHKNIITTAEAFDFMTKKMARLGFGKGSKVGIVVHFRCYDDYYNLQILSELYYQKYFSKSTHGFLGALPAAGGDTTSFNLLNDNFNIVTLDDFTIDNPTIYLQARNAGVIKKNLWGGKVKRYCFHDQLGHQVLFKLQILERNVATPGSASPYS